jgi:hypothetical protein
MEEQLKKVLAELLSAQLIIKLLQEEMNKNPERGSIEPPSIGVRDCAVAINHDDRNWVNSNCKIKTANFLRYLPIPIETSNRYSSLDNLQGASVNLNNGDVRNGKLIKQASSNVNLQELADKHEKSPCVEQESTYHIPTIINAVTVTGASDGIKFSRRDKLIFCDSDPLVHSCINLSPQKWKRKLLIIGDSHARGCATRVKDLINDNFVTCGFVKPGSGANI